MLASRPVTATVATEAQSSLQCHPKVRELVAELESAGFVDRGGKGSHKNFVHPKVARLVTISGNAGDDAKPYQIRAVRLAIEESKK